MYKVRIKFSKHGNLRFIGHLDIMRYFQKAFRRSEIDIAYSKGFSPHQIMSFAAPLGVGMESDGEYMDVELNTMTSSQDIVERLNAQMAVGIKVHSAKVLPEKAKNAMAAMAAAGYYIVPKTNETQNIDFTKAIESLLQKPNILITKETKKGQAEVDLKPGIYNLQIKTYRDEQVLYMLVNASSAGNIKPSMVTKVLLDELGLCFEPLDWLIIRSDTYLNLETNEELSPKFVPLDGIGEEL